jgi:high-affinity nickel-transport protein
MSNAPTMSPGRVDRTRRRRRPLAFWQSLDPAERRTLAAMAFAVVALHAIGFVALIALAAPLHSGVASAGALSVGVGVTAYTLGLRHAFDADHIAAIDNTTRKLIDDGRRPSTVGFWFSLGHSTVVFALAAALAFGVRALDGPVRNSGSSLHALGSWVGTLASGGFLYVIAALNLVILFEITGVFREMKRGSYDELALERQLARRGLMNRLLGRRMRGVSKPAQMYPIGVLFGLGFDTASEVALLVLAGGAAGSGLPWYAILCLPVLFAAGMSLMDSIDGAFMHHAYDWAYAEPVRKVFYNLIVTGLSVAVALVIGTIELSGLIASRLNLPGSFWSWFEHIDINLLGYVIVGLFLATWVISVTVWRLARIEERWGTRSGTEGAG